MGLSKDINTKLRAFWEASEDLDWTTEQINAELQQRGSDQQFTATQVEKKLRYMGLQ